MAKPRKKEEIPSDLGLAEELRRLATKKLGPVPDHRVNYWLRTGVLLFDLVVGHGLPGGRLVEVMGLPGHGKTAWILNAATQVLRDGGTVVWNHTEGKFSTELCDLVGLDTQHPGWVFHQTNAMEKYFDFLEESAQRAVQRETPTLFVVDSLAGLCPRDRSMEKTRMVDSAPMARRSLILTEFFGRGFMTVLQGRNIFVVFINQARKAIGSPVPGELETPGGLAFEHYGALRLRISLGEWIRRDGSGGPRVGGMMTLRLLKSCVSPNFRKATVPWYFDPRAPVRGFDEFASWISYLAGQNVMAATGNGRYSLDGVTDTAAGWRERLVADPLLRQQIRELVIGAFLREHGMLVEGAPLPAPTDSLANG